jgi:hypothetical protein
MLYTRSLLIYSVGQCLHMFRDYPVGLGLEKVVVMGRDQIRTHEADEPDSSPSSPPRPFRSPRSPARSSFLRKQELRYMETIGDGVKHVAQKHD